MVPGGNVLNVPAMQWHSLRSLESGTVLLECKDVKWEPLGEGKELAVWYNDNVIYPDKVRLNCYYYRHYSFVKDIQMILCTVLGRKMEYAGEEI